MVATTVTTRLRRSTPTNDSYTVRVADRRVDALVTAHPGDARRWISTSRWLHHDQIRSGRLVVGLGVQWTPTGRPLHGDTPPPATLQLCAGDRSLVFHLAQADAVPAALHHFLADPRITFAGSGSSFDRRMLQDHYGLNVASGCELRSVAGMGNASMENMADRFLGYPGIEKPHDVSMSEWHAPQLSPEQVEYACVDAYLASRLGNHLCPAGQEPQRAPELPRAGAPPPAQQATPPAQPAARVPQPHPAVARTGIAVAGARPGVAGSDSEAEDGGKVGDNGTVSVTRSSYTSDEDDFFSDESGLLGDGAVTDDEEGIEDYVARSGILSDDDLVSGFEVGILDDEEEDEEEDVEEEEERYSTMIPTVNNEEEKIEDYVARSGILSDDDLTLGFEIDTGILNDDSTGILDDEDEDEEEEERYSAMIPTVNNEEEGIEDYAAQSGILSDHELVLGYKIDTGILDDVEVEEEEERYSAMFVFPTVNNKEEGIEDYVARSGMLSDDDLVLGYKIDMGSLQEEEECYEGYTGIAIGIPTHNNEDDTGNEVFAGYGVATAADVEEDGVQLDGYHALEYFISGEAEYYDGNGGAFDGGEDGHGQQDDWYDQGDYGCDQYADQGDYGYDQDAGGYEEYY